jgi:hypothetical protein
LVEEAKRENEGVLWGIYIAESQRVKFSMNYEMGFMPTHLKAKEKRQ